VIDIIPGSVINDFYCDFNQLDRSPTTCRICEDDLPTSYKSRRLKAQTDTKEVVVTGYATAPRLENPSLLNTNPLECLPAGVLTYP
jgi:hypothetical protein